MSETQVRDNLITVVIPNYNGMQYLGDCLHSLREQTVPARVIVVDNCSRDGSDRLVEEQYPEVLLFRLSSNTGFCHAVNTGLHLVQTPYAFLLNNDTRVEKDCLERLLGIMEKNRHLFSVQALMLSMQNPEVIDDAGDLCCALGWAFARGKGKERSTAGNRTRRIFAACAGAAMYRMSVFDDIGWFDERHYCYLEDIDIGWRAQISGYGNRMEPGAVVYHAGSATTGSRYNEFKETMTSGNNAYLLYKNMPAAQYVLNAPLWMLGRAVKKRYFSRMGFGEAFERGLARGEYLKAEAYEQSWMERYEFPYKKGTLSDEACVENEEETLNDFLPLYLGNKVPFRLRNLPYYFSIQGQLIAGCFRRLVN